MIRSSRGGAAVLFVAVAAGCGGGGSAPVDFDQLFARVIVALCKYEVACNSMPDTATCMASLQQEPGYIATIKQDIAAGKVKYDAVKAGACIDLIERLYGAACSRTAAAGIGDLDSGVCDEVFTGTVAVGGACFFTEECAAGGNCTLTDGTCSRLDQCCPGTCVAKSPTVPLGGDCSTGQICALGTYCATAATGGSRKCVAASAADGAACTSTTQCAPPLYCNVDPGTGTGACRRPVATGGACNVSIGSSGCDDGRDYCDTSTGTCTRRVAPGGDCSAGQGCVGYAQCQTTTCVARPGPGGSCTSTGGLSCLGSLQCDASTTTCMLVPQGGVCL